MKFERVLQYQHNVDLWGSIWLFYFIRDPSTNERSIKEVLVQLAKLENADDIINSIESKPNFAGWVSYDYMKSRGIKTIKQW